MPAEPFCLLLAMQTVTGVQAESSTHNIIPPICHQRQPTSQCPNIKNALTPEGQCVLYWGILKQYQGQRNQCTAQKQKDLPT